MEIITDRDNFTCEDFTITFTAVPSNAGANVTYQWRKDGIAIDGATNNTLTLDNETLTDESNIDVVMFTQVNCAEPDVTSNAN